MSRAPFALALLATATVTHTAARSAEPILPTPPRQAEPWTPPKTTLPRFLVVATTALCEQGLADPRGCDYRKIKLTVGSVWGVGDGQAETTGWVLPAPDHGKARYAIAWSGLVYPVAGDLGPGNLDADMRALAGAADAISKGNPARGGGFNGFGSNNEASSIDVHSYHAIKVCLLLRLGRADLAELIWAAASGKPRVAKANGAGPKLDLNSYGVSYLTLARDLAWYHFDRAICAHMRGDDRIALADARFLIGFVRAVELKAEAIGFERPERGDAHGEPAPYIEFLGQLPELLSDQERRAWERAKPLPPPEGHGRQAKVAALIRDLDKVAARQWGQPGGVVLGESPIIKDLIAQGDAAVEPLIRAFRTEDRLTRSVGFHRDFFRSRTILRADQAAFTALTGILKVTNFAPPAAGGPNGPRTRDEVADEIQAYWDQNRAIPLAERWYRTLADDTAGDKAWLEAAGNIIQRENVRTIPGGGAFTVTETTKAAPGVTPKFRGEVLRKGHEPTVAALMARRVESMSKTPEGQQFEMLAPCRMTAILAEWDPVAGLPTLRAMTRICRERYARPDNGHDWTSQNLAVAIARFTVARDKAGDPDAVGEYAKWVRTTAPEWLAHNALAVLEPLYSKPGDPTLAGAAGWLFGDPRSPWRLPIGRKGLQPTFHLAELIASPLVEVPAFRTMLLTALEDRTPVGKAEAGDNGTVNVSLDDGFSMGASTPGPDRDAPPRGAVEPVRICDFYAWRLATLEGAPAFNPCWPQKKRDNAVAALAVFLKHKGTKHVP
jgi:hypothetical protein